MTDYQKVVIETEIKHTKREIEYLDSQKISVFTDKSYISGRMFSLEDKVRFLEKLLTINE